MGKGRQIVPVLFTHVYSLNGSCSVVLTATNACGEEVISRNVGVLPVGPIHRIYLPLV